jgi:hypothetical protein
VAQYLGTQKTRKTRDARKRQKVKREEMEEKFVEAGWSLDDSFEDYLLIGHDGYRLSLLAHEEYWGTDRPIFEILDHEDMNTYWVHEVPTPRQAARLLREHSRPPEEWDLHLP